MKPRFLLAFLLIFGFKPAFAAPLSPQTQTEIRALTRDLFTSLAAYDEAKTRALWVPKAPRADVLADWMKSWKKEEKSRAYTLGAFSGWQKWDDASGSRVRFRFAKRVHITPKKGELVTNEQDWIAVCRRVGTVWKFQTFWTREPDFYREFGEETTPHERDEFLGIEWGRNPPRFEPWSPREETLARQAILGLLNTYRREDLAAFRACWNPKTPRWAEIRDSFAPDLKNTSDNRFEDVFIRWGRRRIAGGQIQWKCNLYFTWTWLKKGETKRQKLDATWMVTLLPPAKPGARPLFWERVPYYSGYGEFLQKASSAQRGRVWENDWEQKRCAFAQSPSPQLKTAARARIEAVLRAYEAGDERALRANWRRGDNAEAFATFAVKDWKEADQTRFSELQWEHWKLFQDEAGWALRVRMRAKWSWRDLATKKPDSNRNFWIWTLRLTSSNTNFWGGLKGSDAGEWKVNARWTRPSDTFWALSQSENPVAWARVLNEEHEFQRVSAPSASQIKSGQSAVAALMSALQRGDVAAGKKIWDKSGDPSFGDTVARMLGERKGGKLGFKNQKWTLLRDADGVARARLRVRFEVLWTWKGAGGEPDRAAQFWDLWLEPDSDSETAWHLVDWRRRDGDLVRSLTENPGFYSAWVLDGERANLGYDRLWELYQTLFQRLLTDREGARRVAFGVQCAALLTGDSSMGARALAARATLQNDYFYDENGSAEIASEQMFEAVKQHLLDGNLDDAATAWRFLGDQAYAIGDAATARAIHLQALSNAEKTDNRGEQSDLLVSLGASSELLQAWEEAAAYYERARTLAEGEQDHARALKARFALALWQANQDRLGPALLAMIRCRDEAGARGLKSEQGRYSSMIGSVLQVVGQSAESTAAFENALGAASNPYLKLEAITLLAGAAGERFTQSGGLLDREGKNPELTRVLELVAQGTALYQNHAPSRNERRRFTQLSLIHAETLLNKSRLSALKNSPKNATLAQIAGLLEGLPDKLGTWGEPEMQAAALLIEADLFREQKRPVEALQKQEQAHLLAEKTYKATLTASLSVRGDILRDLNRLDEAAASYQQAIAFLEARRAGAQDKLLQSGVTQSGIGLYQNLAECLRLQNAPGDEILAAVEGARARSLTEMMAGGARPENGVSPLQQKREADLQRAVTQLQLRLDALSGAQNQKQLAVLQSAARGGNQNRNQGDGDDDDLSPRAGNVVSSDTTPIRRELVAAQRELEAFGRELRLQNPELSAKRAQWSAPTLAQIGEKLFRDRPKRRILSYVVGDEATMLLVLSPGAKEGDAARLDTFSLPITRAALIGKIRDARKGLSRPSSVGDDLSELQSLLLAPAQALLEGAEELIIIPDGPLGGLPFAALNDEDGTFLLEKHEISYAPGIAALIEMERVQARRQSGETGEKRLPFLGMSRSDFTEIGMKPLPGAGAEVRAIAPIFGEGALIAQDEGAGKSFARREMPRARWIHLATHGILNEAAPLYSAVALAPDAQDPDGRLYARDLMQMNLQADLVVLSACETALGQEVRGEGILGLTWALFVAGAPTSVVTQWSVDDSATSMLMPLFYRGLRDGQRPAAAMRSAQLALLKSKITKHPAFWAPFIVVGASD